MPPPPTLADNFKQFQDLIKRVVDSLPIPVEEVKELHHKVLDILHTSSSAHFALPIHEALLDPAKVLWQTLATIPPTYKRVDKNILCSL